MKGGNKQDETWINPFIKQFTNLSFSVSIRLCLALLPFHRACYNAQTLKCSIAKCSFLLWFSFYLCLSPLSPIPFLCILITKKKKLFIDEKWFCNHYPGIHPISLMLYCIYVGVLVREPVLDWIGNEGRKCF